MALSVVFFCFEVQCVVWCRDALLHLVTFPISLSSLAILPWPLVSRGQLSPRDLRSVDISLFQTILWDDCSGKIPVDLHLLFLFYFSESLYVSPLTLNNWILGLIFNIVIFTSINKWPRLIFFSSLFVFIFLLVQKYRHVKGFANIQQERIVYHCETSFWPLFITPTEMSTHSCHSSTYSSFLFFLFILHFNKIKLLVTFLC